jgi:dTDP-4-amino-4,6-dideoxygalactose transaminase
MIPHSKPTIGTEEMNAVSRVLHSGQLAQGAEVEAFEKDCADMLGRKFGVAVNSGTAALHLAISGFGVARDEPVAVPSYGCAALITAVRLQQASPRLCDIDGNYNLDPALVPPDCRAAIVPHLFGATAVMPDTDGAIEDIAQSMGGPTGRATRVAVTSFYATKLMTTGEGGMLLTDDEAIAEHARDLREYDNRDDFVVRYPYKMTDIQAALGRVQIRRLPGFLERRREMALQYNSELAGLPLRLPNPAGHVFFRYVVETDRQRQLIQFLNARGIEAKRPVYRPAHHYIGGDFPNSQRAHEQCVSLPLYPAMTSADIRCVIDTVQRFFNEGT